MFRNKRKLKRAALDVIKYARHLVDCEKNLKNSILKDLIKIKVFSLLKRSVDTLDKEEYNEEKTSNRRSSRIG